MGGDLSGVEASGEGALTMGLIIVRSIPEEIAKVNAAVTSLDALFRGG
jgi:hypothetical protein